MNGGRVLLPALVAGLTLGIWWTDAHDARPELAAITALVVAVASRIGGRWMATVGLTLAMVAAGAAIGVWRGGEHQPPAGTVQIAELAGTPVALAGSVVEDPRPRGQRLQVVLDDLAVIEPASNSGPVGGRLLVWLPRGPDLALGDRLRLEAAIEEPEDFEGFAYREYLARRAIGGIARPGRVEVIGHTLGPLEQLTAGPRGTLLRGLNSLVPEPEASVGAGMALGVRTGIAEEISDAFATAGLSHVVAISGFHIAIVAGAVMLLTEPLRRRRGGRWLAAGVTLGVIAWYVLLTGTRPSAIRAALMAVALTVAQLSGSRAHAASALLLAALLMLLATPSVLWDVGFQLSLLATAGIILAAVPIAGRLGWWPAAVRGPVALTMAAQLTTLPVLLMNFERLSLVAPLANVLAVPMVPLAMAASAAAAIVGAVEQALHLPLVGDLAAWLAGGAAWLYLRILIGVAIGCAHLPFAALDVELPASLAVAYWAMLGAALLGVRARGGRGPDDPGLALGATAQLLHPAGLGRHPTSTHATDGGRDGTGPLRRLARRSVSRSGLGAVTVGMLLAITLATGPDGRLHLVVLDIGQGDAILIRGPTGATALIDGGPDPDVTLRRLGEELPFTRRRFDVLILTHPHQDHVAGLVEVLERFSVGMVLEADRPYANAAYDRLVADARERGILATARAGQRIALDIDTSLEILFPGEADGRAPLPDGDINNASVVALLRHGGFSALLTGDAEAPVEAALLARDLIGPVDVLKAGHHGSHSSTTPALLDAAAPSVVLISLGTGNQYGHPSPQTLETLADRPGIAVYRTDLHGSIAVISDGSGFVVSGTGTGELVVDGGPDARHPHDAGSIGVSVRLLCVRRVGS